MSAIKESTRYLSLKEDEPPPKKLVTEADMLIKNLAKRQLNTKVTLNEYIQEPKAFQKVSEQISLTSCHSGPSSLTQFKDVMGRIENIEHLKSAGLDNERIQLLLDYQQNNLDAKYRNIQQEVLQQKLNIIHEILRDYKDKQENFKCIDNKERELKEETMLAAKPNSTETNLLKFALGNMQNKTKFPSPLDHLKKVENNMFSHLNDEVLNPVKVQKRIRNINKRINNIGNDEMKMSMKKIVNFNVEQHTFTKNSKWDKRESIEPQRIGTNSKFYTCKPQNYYTIENGKIVQLNDNEVQNRGLTISQHKLSIDEIKKMSMFQNYDPGHPSDVLYVKNLPRNITEKDLKEIFGEFCKDGSTTFRIMSGRMKGQAFITFADQHKAAVALENINGLLINSKPVVIEYGRKIKNC